MAPGFQDLFLETPIDFDHIHVQCQAPSVEAYKDLRPLCPYIVRLLCLCLCLLVWLTRQEKVESEEGREAGAGAARSREVERREETAPTDSILRFETTAHKFYNAHKSYNAHHTVSFITQAITYCTASVQCRFELQQCTDSIFCPFFTTHKHTLRSCWTASNYSLHKYKLWYKSSA